jgi:glycosyltransferase involved in cell wall biosynthesis
MLRPLEEPFAVDSAVTIVLPVHNAERTLRPLVTRILELATAPARRLTIAIVDDGSTDETFEAAGEIARDFPQVRIFRQPHQGGLGAALQEIRRRLSVDEVILHDGVGAIDLDELAALLAAASGDSGVAIEAPARTGRGSRRFAAVAALNARMSEAHRAIASFHWMKLAEPPRPRRQPAPLASLGASPTLADMPAVLP